MKRSRLTRKTGLKRSQSLSRSALKRRPKSSGYDLGLAGQWYASVVGGKACITCGSRSRVEGHHVIPKRDIKQWALSKGLTTADAQKYLWDGRNGVPLCAVCHQRHETAFKRVPRRLVPPAALRFAEEIELDYLLERYYPDM